MTRAKKITIRSFSIRLFRIPLKRPFITALGRKTHTVNAGLTLRLSDGSEGYGEASSSLALAHLGPRRIAAILSRLAGSAVGEEISHFGALAETAWRRYGAASPATAAFECALLEAFLRSRGLDGTSWFGGQLNRVETDITLSAAEPAETWAAAVEAGRQGFRTLKIKVSGEIDEDLERLRAVRQALPRARLIIDGNQGMSPSQALKLTEKALAAGCAVDLLEQPVPKHDWRGLREISRRCPVLVAADESVSSPEAAARLADRAAVGAFNIKIAKSGIARSLAIAAVARAAGLKLMIGCMCESPRGLRSSVALALGTGFFSWVDLDSDLLLEEYPPLRDESWRRRAGAISIS